MAGAKYLVTGAAGMLGSQLARAAPSGVEAVPTTRAEVDLAEAEHVELLFERVRPDGVIHAAGFTDVDRAEVAEEVAYRDNVVATEAVSAASRRRGIPLVVVSTDYVFDGETDRPYREDDPPRPLNAYGRTKLAAEQEAPGATVVRSSWLYGPRGRHFPATILRLARERDEIEVVDDQRGSPTSTLELAPALWDVLLRGERGAIYHAACGGSCTWHELAVAVLELAGVRGVKVRPCTTEAFPRPARRPARSDLDGSRLAALRGRPLAPWRDALRRYLESHA